MLAYYMLKYPLKCAAAGTTGAHFTDYLNTQGWQNHVLTSEIYCLWLMNMSVASEYTDIRTYHANVRQIFMHVTPNTGHIKVEVEVRNFLTSEKRF